MTIEWLAGNRLRGTTAERPSASLQSPSVGGWVELARTTLGSTNDNIAVTSLSDKRYYMYLFDGQPSGQIAGVVRLNSDTGNNYSARYSTNGGSDGTGTSQSYMNLTPAASSLPEFGVGYLSNLSTKEKLMLAHSVEQNTAGAGTSPQRREATGKHAQTSNPISAITLNNQGSGDFASGSEVVVLGWDPDDTHTTNFWEELASVELGSAVTNLSSGTISAKKYLWCQVFTKSSSGTIPLNMTFNNDTGNNYAQRRSIDGSLDSTNTSRANIQLQADTAADVKFNNIFIINNSSNEKLVIHHSAESQASGAATAPVRRETVGKWANTSAQITEIDIDSTSGNYDTGSILKVWGAD